MNKIAENSAVLSGKKHDDAMSRCKADIPFATINPRIYRGPSSSLRAEIKFHRNRGGTCDIFLAVMRNRLGRDFDAGHPECTSEEINSMRRRMLVGNDILHDRVEYD